MASYQPGKASSFQNILSFAAAGVAYFFIAHLLSNFLFYLSLRVIGLPAEMTIGSYRIHCSAMGNYWDTHGQIHVLWIKAGHLILLSALIMAGYLIFRAKRRSVSEKTLGVWLSILLLALPIYKAARIIAWIIMRGISSGSLAEAIDASWYFQLTWLGLMLYACIVGLWLYFKAFNKHERKYLWLVSLPAFIVTYLAWFFLVGPMIFR